VGNPASWLIFLGMAMLALVLPTAAVALLALLSARPTAGRGRILCAAGLGAGVATIAAATAYVACATGLDWLPPGLHTSHIALLSVPLISAGFLVGAGVGFLVRGSNAG
jgi:hypothetical protein